MEVIFEIFKFTISTIVGCVVFVKVYKGLQILKQSRDVKI